MFEVLIDDCTQPESAIARVVKKEVKKKVRKLRGYSDSDTDDDEFDDGLVRVRKDAILSFPETRPDMEKSCGMMRLEKRDD